MKQVIDFRSSKTRMFFLGIVDVVTILLNSYLALLIRHEGHHEWISPEYLMSIEQYAWINVITTIIIFIVLNLYRSVWTYAGVHEAVLIVAACILSTTFQALGFLLFNLHVPRSYYIIYFFLMVMTTIFTRFSYRFLRAMQRSVSKTESQPINTMVVGAGEAGSMIVHEIKTSRHLNRNLVCIIDDNPSKKGKYLQGVRIVGDRNEIISSAEKYEVEEIILAIPSASPKTTKEILQICNQTNCKLKILPGMYQLITEEVSVSKLKEVSIEDLLGRDSIHIDLDSVAGYVTGKTVLVTGGGGSIGSELCRQIANYNPKCLIIFDIYENNAYDIQQELKVKYPQLHLEVLIGSVRNTKRIEWVMSHYRPDVVYHAAAHKHVPLMEDSPNEAIKNNVFGTYKTARAADKYGVKRFVLISTDKAVNPTNIMGASKRLCEMVIQTFNKYSDTEYVAVRFGNVLGSNGSVIPLFKKQMEAGGPVTVTHPDIIRYFMTIPEASQLVLQSGMLAKNGEIFVLDMGKSIRILELAENMIRLSGVQGIEIVETGLRPGEKLYEELLVKTEELDKTENKMIFVERDTPLSKKEIAAKLQMLKEACEAENNDMAREALRKAVPTFRRPEEVNCTVGKEKH